MVFLSSFVRLEKTLFSRGATGRLIAINLEAIARLAKLSDAL